MPRSDDRPGSRPPRGAATLAARTGSNGHGDLPRAGHAGGRRPLPGPSTKPALVVLGIIAALFVTGFVVDTLTSGGSHPASTSHALSTAPGAPLRAVAAGPLVHGIVSQGEPPSDIVHALAAPARSSAVANSITSRGVELYDRSIRLQAPATEQDVIAFFRAQMPFMHWKRLSEGPKSGGYQLLFQHPGSDGHEWELGVTVSPTQFPAAGTTSSPGGATQGTTAFTVRLFAQSDQD